MARVEFIEQRLLNWARWKIARGGEGGRLGFAGVSFYPSNAGRGGYVTAVIPISDVEAAATDEAVQRLQPGGLRLAVHAFYVEAGTLGQRAAELGIAESTLYLRIDQAHRQLADHFLAQQDRAKAERQRVETVTAAAAPLALPPGKFGKRKRRAA